MPKHHQLATLWRMLAPALCATLFWTLALPHTAMALSAWEDSRIQDQITALEASVGGRLGIMAIYAPSGEEFAHRADERFALCSTFKMVLAGAVLHQAQSRPGGLSAALDHPLTVPSTLVSHSPVTMHKAGQPMLVRELAAASVEMSDNTATNMLLDYVGGVQAVRDFARALGDPLFRLDRYEPEMNSAIPGDSRDTATPRGMATLLRTMLFGDALDSPAKALLEQWLANCKTAPQRITAAVPQGWSLGHKTGSGSNGTSNDVAIIRPDKERHLVLAIYLTQSPATPEERDAVISKAAALLMWAWR